MPTVADERLKRRSSRDLRPLSSRRSIRIGGSEVDRVTAYIAARQKQSKIDADKHLYGYDKRKEPTAFLINIESVSNISLEDTNFEA